MASGQNYAAAPCAAPIIRLDGSVENLPKAKGCRMCGLIEADFAAAGQLDRCLDSPSLPFRGRAAHAFSLQRFHQRRQIVAHQVEDRAQELASPVQLASLAVGGMNPDLRGGKANMSQPPPASTAGKLRMSRKKARSASGLSL